MPCLAPTVPTRAGTVRQHISRCGAQLDGAVRAGARVTRERTRARSAHIAEPSDVLIGHVLGTAAERPPRKGARPAVMLAPSTGLEPVTVRLTVGCSAN